MRISDSAASARACIDGIALGQRDGRTLQTEQLGDRQMLPRLRHRPVIRGDDEQQEIDAGGPGQHVVDQLLVAGDVDEAGSVLPSGKV